MSPTGDGTAILRWSSEPREGPSACIAKGVPSFLSYFNTLSNCPALQSSAMPTERSSLRILPSLLATRR